MNILELSEIIFNFTATAAMLVLAVLLGIIAFEIIQAIKRAKKVANDIKEGSVKAFEKLDRVLLAVTSLSFMSKLFNKSKHKKDEK